MVTRKPHSHTSPVDEHGTSRPRLPHEHDESSDSQNTGQRNIIRQAQDDLNRGLTDTDKGPVLDEVYARTLRKPAKKKR